MADGDSFRMRASHQKDQASDWRIGTFSYLSSREERGSLEIDSITCPIIQSVMPIVKSPPKL